MKKLYQKIENWLWIVLLVGALIYFHWLIGSFHAENEKLRDSQKRFGQEVEERYEKSRQFQIEIQAQLNEATQKLSRFLRFIQQDEAEQFPDPVDF